MRYVEEKTNQEATIVTYCNLGYSTVLFTIIRSNSVQHNVERTREPCEHIYLIETHQDASHSIVLNYILRNL